MNTLKNFFPNIHKLLKSLANLGVLMYANGKTLSTIKHLKTCTESSKYEFGQH